MNIIEQGTLRIQSVEFETVGGIREYLAVIEKYGLPDSTPLSGWASLTVEGKVLPINCGNHGIEDMRQDALVYLHEGCE